MTFGKRPLWVSSFLMISLFSLPSCTVEAPGVSVKTYREPAVVLEAEERQQQEMTRSDSADERRHGKTTSLRRNTAFPSISSVRAMSFPSITGCRPATRDSSRPSTPRRCGRTARSPFIFADDVQVSGHTAGEIRNILTGLARKYMREPAHRGRRQGVQEQSCPPLRSDQHPSVSGECLGPGRYPLVGKTRVLDLIVSGRRRHLRQGYGQCRSAPGGTRSARGNDIP